MQRTFSQTLSLLPGSVKIWVVVVGLVLLLPYTGILSIGGDDPDHAAELSEAIDEDEVAPLPDDFDEVISRNEDGEDK